MIITSSPQAVGWEYAPDNENVDADGWMVPGNVNTLHVMGTWKHDLCG